MLVFKLFTCNCNSVEQIRKGPEEVNDLITEKTGPYSLQFDILKRYGISLL